MLFFRLLGCRGSGSAGCYTHIYFACLQGIPRRWWAIMDAAEQKALMHHVCRANLALQEVKPLGRA